MRILNVHNSFYLLGGGEKYYFDLTALLERNGNEVIPFSLKNRKNFYTPYEDYFMSPVDFFGKKDLFDYFRIATRVISSPEAKIKVKRVIHSFRPRIAHLHAIFHGISPSILPILKDSGIPVVQTAHIYEAICPVAYLYARGRPCDKCKGHRYFYAPLYRCNRELFWASLLCCIKMYIHKITKVYENNVDLFLTPSRFMQDKLIEFGLEADKIRYIPLFIDIDIYSPAYTPDSKYILYFGRLKGYKGIITLIRALKKVRGVMLYIVGEGPLRPKIEELIERHQLENVRLLGFKSGEELKEIIRGARFIVMPSEWYENAGLALLESFASGKPVIGSNIGGIPEFIEHGRDGLLFEPGNVDDLAGKIQFLIDRPGLSTQMGKEARIKVEKQHNPQLHYQRLKEVYEELL